MHSYVNSLLLFKNRTRETLTVSKTTGTMSLVGLLVGGGISYCGNFSPFWRVATMATTTFAAFATSTCFDSYHDAKNMQDFLRQYDNQLDRRFVQCMKQNFKLNDLQFSDGEVMQIARELIENNLFNGLENLFIRKFIPARVINEINHPTCLPTTPTLR